MLGKLKELFSPDLRLNRDMMDMQLKKEQLRLEKQEGLRAIDNELKKYIENKNFKEFEGKIKSEFGVNYNESEYESYFGYVSSLFMLHIMNKSFKEKKIVLPDNLEAIDIGAGDWHYVHSLYKFLKNYQGERNVHLTGIDMRGELFKDDVNKLIQIIPAEYISKDIFELNKNGAYDLVFVAHMLTGPDHFRKFGMKYRPSSMLFEKSFEILQKDGLFLCFAHMYGGEGSILNDFPIDKKILDKHFEINFGEITNFLWGYHTFNDNYFLIGKK